MATFILAIDAGTTSTRAIIYDEALTVRSSAQRGLKITRRQHGVVHQDPVEILEKTRDVCAEAIHLAKLGSTDRLIAGLTNQRETFVLFDRQTKTPLCSAVSWQDTSSAESCEHLRQELGDAWFQQRTGLPINPYFTASKLQNACHDLLRQNKDVNFKNIAFGTIDSWLISGLQDTTQEIVIEHSNASRTLLYGLHEGDWLPELLEAFSIPEEILPKLIPSQGDLCEIFIDGWPHPIPLTAILGDQQASLYGHVGQTIHGAKLTYGTGAFGLINTGTSCAKSGHGLLSTVFAKLPTKTLFALEGSIFFAGAVVDWLRDQLGLFTTFDQLDELLSHARMLQDLPIFIPAFNGLGTPYWETQCRASWLGMEAYHNQADLSAAAVSSIAWVTADFLKAAEHDLGLQDIGYIGIDGGLSDNRWFQQTLSDISQYKVRVPYHKELTSLGVAKLAAEHHGLDVKDTTKDNATFCTPKYEVDDIEIARNRWSRAISSTINFGR